MFRGHISYSRHFDDFFTQDLYLRISHSKILSNEAIANFPMFIVLHGQNNRLLRQARLVYTSAQYLRGYCCSNLRCYRNHSDLRHQPNLRPAYCSSITPPYWLDEIVLIGLQTLHCVNPARHHSLRHLYSSELLHSFPQYQKD